MNSPSPYQVLGIPNDASEQDIKRAYKRAALKHHPDRNNESHESKLQAEGKMMQINAAYGILKDPDQKRKFDHIHKYGGMTSGNNGASNFNAGANPSNATKATRRWEERERAHVRRRQNRASPFIPAFHDHPKSENGEIHFKVPYGTDPFVHIPAGSVHSGVNSNDGAVSGSHNRTGTSGFSFTFSSTSNRSIDSNGTITYTRKVILYQGGYKETHLETVTVGEPSHDRFSRAVYRSHIEREKTESPLHGFKKAISETFSRLINPNAKESDPKQSSSGSETSSSRGTKINSSRKSNDGDLKEEAESWYSGLYKEVARYTSACGS